MKAAVVYLFGVVLLASCSSVEKQSPPEVKFDKFAMPEALPPSPSQRPSRGGGLSSGGGDLTPRIELVILKTEGESDSPPKERLPILASVIYPRELARARVTGDATVRLTVEKDGRVSSVSVVHASQQEFADAITAKSNRFSFYPAVRSGSPVVSHIVCKLSFSLHED